MFGPALSVQADGWDLPGLSGIGMGIGDIFINLSAEYPAILDGILLVIAAAGVLLTSTAFIEVIKQGRRDSVNYAPSAAFWWKMLGGVGLVDLAFWAKVWTDTLWSLSDPLDISSYSVGSGEDYTRAAIMAAVGIFVISGYVVLARAYFAATRLGYLSPEARGDVTVGIIWRIVAGSAMIACLHIVDAIENSTGFNWIPV